MPEAVNPSELLQIAQIFKSNGWGYQTKTSMGYNLYDSFIQRTEIIPRSNRQLFFDLTGRFNWIRLIDLIPYFFAAYNKIDPKLLDNARKVYFLALKDYTSDIQLLLHLLKTDGFGSAYNFLKEGRQDTKSNGAELLVSLFQRSEYRNLAHCSKFVFPTNFKRFKNQFKPKKDLVILIDDYTGTGNTAIRALDILYKKKHFGIKLFNHTNTIILNLISQKAGEELILQTQKTKIYQNISVGKGISDHYPTPQVALKIEEMKAIEKRMHINPELSLGYGQSEGLVSINGKCPNNTFPVFWYETKKHAAPFPRRKIFIS